MKFTLLGFIKNLIGESLSSPDSPVTIEFTSMKPWKNPSTGKWFLYFNGLNITDGEVSGHPRQIVYLEGPNSDYEFDAKYFDYYRNKNTGRLPLFIFDKEYPNEIDKLGFFKSTSTGNGEINSKTIREALKLAFPENWLERDKVFSAGLRDVYPIGDKTGDGETWSIMNFFDTKKEIHELLKKEWEKDGSPEDVIGWMVETFRNKSAFVQSLVDRQ